MASKRAFLIWWVGGLAAFAFTLSRSAVLRIEGVPSGILDHQAAGNAATVDAIHKAWAAVDLIEPARIAMISDLVFIGIYSIGAILGGRYYRGSASPVLIRMGWAAFLSGIVFLITDYGETICQFIQLTQTGGDDGLAGFAATMQPIKIVSFLISFFALCGALILERFWKSSP